MKIEDFKGKKNEVLGQFCLDNDIEVSSKTANKPTKDEYLAAIEDYISSISIEVLKPEVEVEVVKDVALTPTETKALKKKIQKSEYFAKFRVLVRSNKTAQTQTTFEFVTWGNDLLGHHSERAVIGAPWHLTRGAIENLEAATAIISVPGVNNQPVKKSGPAYNVQYLEALTEDGLSAIAKRQTIIETSHSDLL